MYIVWVLSEKMLLYLSKYIWSLSNGGTGVYYNTWYIMGIEENWVSEYQGIV